MDAIVTFFIALMPFFAVAPLALALVVVFALAASPRARHALGEWTQRRLGVSPAPAVPAARAVDTAPLEARVRELESRLAFVERLVTLPPRPDAPAALPSAPRTTTPRPNTPPA
jgi:hypothetical protein